MVSKKKQRGEREKAILMGLVDLFLLTGKPVGSNVLKENRFQDISSATIRNYFAKLEKEGFLIQEHASAGRIPTPAAFKLYAAHYLHANAIDPKEFDCLKKELDQETQEVARYLQTAAERLSHLAQGAVFLSSPRFDQDLVVQIKLLDIDAERCLAAIVTHFGLIHTQILSTPKKLTTFSIKRLEAYFHFQLTGLDRPYLSEEEDKLASHFYHELMMRHIVGHSNFHTEDLYKTGFSKLILFPEFRDPSAIATALSIFENTSYMRSLLKKSMKSKTLKVWIGDDLKPLYGTTVQSTILAIPYFIHGKAVGAIALLGPIRMPYPKIFALLKNFSLILSEVLTRNLYKYKITYRQAEIERVALRIQPPNILEQLTYKN